MENTASVEEMIEVAEKFKWLAEDAKDALSSLVDPSFSYLKHLISTRTEPCDKSLYSFVCPTIILMGNRVSRARNIPEYYGAFQYVAARLTTEK